MSNFETGGEIQPAHDEQQVRYLGRASVFGPDTGFPFVDRRVAEHLEAEAALVPLKDRVEEARIAVAGGEEAMAEFLLGKS